MYDLGRFYFMFANFFGDAIIPMIGDPDFDSGWMDQQAREINGQDLRDARFFPGDDC
jgi:hypothetical protein